MAHGDALLRGRHRYFAGFIENGKFHVDFTVVVDGLEHVPVQRVVGTETEVAVVVADDQMQMLAVDAAQAFKRVLAVQR